MPGRMTRRQWTAGLTAAITVAPAAGQVTSKVPPQGPPAAPPAAATPQQKLQKAYADVHQITVRLSQIEMPMNVEPAFAFRA
jgi:hypothetical protein